MITVEDSLWLFLAAGLMPLCYGDWQAWTLLLESICFLFVIDPTTPGFSFNSPLELRGRSPTNSTVRIKQQQQQQQQQQQGRKLAQSMGVQMSIVLVPSLLQAMAIYKNKNSIDDDDYSRLLWNRYSKLVTILVIPQMHISVVLFAISLFFDPPLPLETTTTTIPITFFFFSIVWFLFRPMLITKNIEKSFTFGELRVVSLLLLVIVVEYFRRITIAKTIIFSYNSQRNNDNIMTTVTVSSLYSLVALSGSISCCAFVYISGSSYVRNRLSWWSRLGLNVVGPLLVVDASLYLNMTTLSTTTTTISDFSTVSSSFYRYLLPLSVQWLIEFLMEKENGYQRIWGIIYWGGILIVASYPTNQLLSLQLLAAGNKNINKDDNKPSVVVIRKWFHLIAVFLFGPITWIFPELMSISYAIATCILIVLESLRSDAPLLQFFYLTFLDDQKDDGQNVIISHVFLIVGCAAPLWINQILSENDEDNDDGVSSSSRSHSLLLAEFGVICIGIGDAMGAVIGKSMGKHYWGMNHRTLEGSLAMWLSMIGIGMLVCTSMQEYVALLVATTFTTILEAFTVQIDNLVLPLSGSIIILLILAYS
mmetsp:Transcript_31102/g.34843  ORF Transcript_31102/g.34843 Transcript_31102/m.34843 type:complete len:592 (+) Transcript_31102:99-1874(+)